MAETKTIHVYSVEETAKILSLSIKNVWRLIDGKKLQACCSLSTGCNCYCRDIHLDVSFHEEGKNRSLGCSEKLENGQRKTICRDAHSREADN